MFIRVKTTPNSPRKSVQIVQSLRKGDKVRQKIIRYVGIAMDDKELEQLKMLAESIRIKLEADNQELLFSPEDLAKLERKAKETKRDEKEEDYKVNLKDLKEEQRIIKGIHDVYGKLFDDLGYKNIFKNPERQKATVNTFKNIVLGRTANPKSKMASVDMLEEDFGVTLNLNSVYKMMDKIDDKAIEKLNEIAYKNTLTLFLEKIDIIFFDATTIYFESFTDDELKKMGYSKDLKFNQPQIILSLLVTKEGLPIGYKIFPGNTYEGHTLIPVLKELKSKYNLDKIIFVADSAMLNTDNLKALEDNQFEYIVSARLKNMNKKTEKQILDESNYKVHKSQDTDKLNQYKIAKFEIENKRQLIVSYSDKRAKKDSGDRMKAIERLQKKIEKTKNQKEYLSNYGYKKYLKINGKSTIEIDQEKIEKDSKWDGLHGVITNAKDLSNEEILKQYHNLWNVENAFRITKHDLKVRPVFHWVERRVKAHLAISFTAYALVKHLEYRVKLQYKKMSPEKIRQTLIHVQTSILYDKKKKIRYGLPSKISIEANKIYNFMKIAHKLTPYIIEKEKCSAHEKIKSLILQGAT
ncbi:MAG: IS1634 family transposase [Actinobacteria bacterium]|nr:IS1634 family transposase [Actinomycetota bacterium]